MNKIFNDGELDKENNTQKMRVVGVKQPVAYCNNFCGLSSQF